MKRSTTLLISVLMLALAMLLVVSACGRDEGGAAGYGAGGGQSLREGSTAPYHSPIAQDQTYQRILGLNILLYPAPVDDPKFEPFGRARWDLDASAFVDTMTGAFSAQMGDAAVYEQVVDALSDQPFVADIEAGIYGGQPVQVGWVYGNNGSLDLMEYNGITVTLVTAYPAVLIVGGRDKADETAGTFNSSNALAVYIPAKTVVELAPNTLRSMPIRVLKSSGALTAVIVPEGTGMQPATPGNGFDQAQVANNRWLFAFPGVPGGYFAGLTGSQTSINPAD